MSRGHARTEASPTSATTGLTKRDVNVRLEDDDASRLSGGSDWVAILM